MATRLHSGMSVTLLLDPGYISQTNMKDVVVWGKLPVKRDSVFWKRRILGLVLKLVEKTLNTILVIKSGNAILP